jgi:glycosyltransferase involved in cell wall biosynthesis
VRPTRLTICLTHPIQYFAPWFRYIAAQRAELDLTVLYASRPDAAEQGAGFGRAFTWDVDLTSGYRHEFLQPGSAGSVSSDTFFGVDAPDIGASIARTRPDLAIVPGWHSVSQVRALHACRRMGVPVVYRGDSTLESAPRGWRHPIWRARTRLILRRAYDAWLSVGSHSREYLDSFGVPAPMVFDSPHAVDNDFFTRGAEPLRNIDARTAARARLGIEPHRFVLLLAGKLIERKRPLDVIRAAHALGPDALVLVAGDGALRAACELEAARLGVQVCWHGFANQSEMPSIFAMSDCLVVPSAFETWGLVVNEALAAGTPCVASDGVAAAADLLKAETDAGAVHRVDDFNGLVAAIERVRHRVNTTDVTAACRAAVSNHTFERATDGIVEAAERLAARRRVTISANTGSPRVLALCGGMVMVSGLERMTFEVLQIAREHGAAVHCIVNTWGSRLIVDRADALGASWSTGYYWYPLLRRGGAGSWLQSAWDMVRTSAGLLRDAWRFRPTHILVPEFTTGLRNAPALLLARVLGIPVIMRLGNAPDSGGFYGFLWKQVLDRVMTRFVSNSDFTQRELLAHGVDPRKTRVIRNTAPSRAIAPTGQRRVAGRIIYVGQVIPLKGLDLLLDAVGVLRSRGRDITLDVVGEIDGWESPSYGGYRQAIRERVQRADLAGAVRLLGVREDVPSLFAEASLHCCPSRTELREGFGVVNLEAKRAAVPSVVFPTGALPEIVSHREDGWVCTDVSVEALVEGLDYFLSDPDRLQRAGERARASERNFGRDRFAAAWSEELDLLPQAFEVEKAS